MGITTSRHDNIEPSPNSHQLTDTASRLMLDNQKSWSLEYSENLISWKYGAVLWGFDPRIDYTSNVKARLQPWCTHGRHFIVKHDPPSKILQRPYCLLTIVEGCFKQDTYVRLPYAYSTRLHIEPEPAGHYLKSVQVSHNTMILSQPCLIS